MTTRSRNRAAGYSVVEVMMAMALLGLGAVGVMTSLKVVTIGAVGVRDFDVATALAQSWADRMRTDATAWISSTTFGNASLLASGVSGNVILPSTSYGSQTVQAGGDISGSDVAPATSTARFCSAIRYRCVTGAAPDPSCPIVVASAAVFWPREGATAAANPFCTVAVAAAAMPLDGTDRVQAFDDAYRVVTVSTVLTPTLP